MYLNIQEMAKHKHEMLFDSNNYKIVLIGVALILLGFILMAGGNMEDGSIYSFQRITLAPALILIGFIVNGYAIMKKSSNNTSQNENL